MPVIINDQNNKLKLKLAEGVNILSAAVGVTLGPSGRNVILKGINDFPVVTKDGVSVARKVYVEDSVAQLGVEMMKEVSLRADEEGGDGTTTATVIAGDVLHRALEEPEYQGYNVMEMRLGMQAASEYILDKLKEVSRPCKDYESVFKAARISANDDANIAEKVATAVIQYKDSLSSISVYKGRTEHDAVETVNGYSFNRGWFNPTLVTNSNQLIELTDARVVLCAHELDDLEETQKIISTSGGKDILILADGFSNEVINFCSRHSRDSQRRGNIALVKSPGHANRKAQSLSDLAAMTGGTISSSIHDVNCNEFGFCESVTVSQKMTKIFPISEDSIDAKIKERVDGIIEYLKTDALPEFEIEFCQHRLSMLRDGLCHIKVGGATELTVKERFDRYVDALNAGINAYKEGVVAGGGSTLINISVEFFNDEEAVFEKYGEVSVDFKKGFELAMVSIQKPFYKIFENSGMLPDTYYQGITSGDHQTAYNLRTDAVGDMFEVGVIDPVTVTSSSVKYALDVSSIILTTEATVFY